MSNEQRKATEKMLDENWYVYEIIKRFLLFFIFCFIQKNERGQYFGMLFIVCSVRTELRTRGDFLFNYHIDDDEKLFCVSTQKNKLFFFVYSDHLTLLLKRNRMTKKFRGNERELSLHCQGCNWYWEHTWSIFNLLSINFCLSLKILLLWWHDTEQTSSI